MLQNNRSVFQALWPHLTPVSQTQIRLTCKNLYRWSEDWNFYEPQIWKLLNCKNWPEWLSESIIVSKSKKFFLWKWKYQNVEIDVLFRKYEDYILLMEIKLVYQTRQHNDYSFLQISVIDSYTNHKKKNRNLPNDKNTNLFKKYRKMLNTWKGSYPKMDKLFPYCRHLKTPRYRVNNKYSKIYEDSWKKKYYCDICNDIKIKRHQMIYNN